MKTVTKKKGRETFSPLKEGADAGCFKQSCPRLLISPTDSTERKGSLFPSSSPTATEILNFAASVLFGDNNIVNSAKGKGGGDESARKRPINHVILSFIKKEYIESPDSESTKTNTKALNYVSHGRESSKQIKNEKNVVVSEKFGKNHHSPPSSPTSLPSTNGGFFPPSPCHNAGYSSGNDDNDKDDDNGSYALKAHKGMQRIRLQVPKDATLQRAFEAFAQHAQLSSLENVVFFWKGKEMDDFFEFETPNSLQMQVFEEIYFFLKDSPDTTIITTTTTTTPHAHQSDSTTINDSNHHGSDSNNSITKSRLINSEPTQRSDVDDEEQYEIVILPSNLSTRHSQVSNSTACCDCEGEGFVLL